MSENKESMIRVRHVRQSLCLHTYSVQPFNRYAQNWFRGLTLFQKSPLQAVISTAHSIVPVLKGSISAFLFLLTKSFFANSTTETYDTYQPSEAQFYLLFAYM